jgi:E3 ubiquitin-protein ligase UBR4
MMNVHDARRSKSVKVLNLYYNNRAVADLSELKNNWSLWKRARSCHLAFNQTELKVEFPIPITACNFMIELDSFYENLQASSLESLQCPRCSRYVTDKHGICGNCHENAYQCRQCRNINYENLDSFLCNECGYSKYGRFEFNFMAKPSFTFDYMESDEDMKKGLAAIETESENAHRRYQQLLGFKKPLLKLVSSIGETEIDSQKDSVQQMIVSLPGSSSFKINRKIAILGVLYGEKCKMAFDSVSKSVQTLQGLRQVLMAYLEHKRVAHHMAPRMAPRPTNRCFGCANTFVGQCLEWLQVLCKRKEFRQQLVAAGILRELFENNIHQGPKAARIQARSVLCAFTEGDAAAVAELNSLIKQKTMYCLDHHRSMDIASCMRDELQLLSETCSLSDNFWEARLQLVFQLLFRSIRVRKNNTNSSFFVLGTLAEHASVFTSCCMFLLQR